MTVTYSKLPYDNDSTTRHHTLKDLSLIMMSVMNIKYVFFFLN